MAIFKRHARTSGASAGAGEGAGERVNENVVAELVEMFTMLIAASGFLDGEEGAGSGGGNGGAGERRLERAVGGGEGKVRVFT
jgi:hypothetical protein